MSKHLRKIQPIIQGVFLLLFLLLLLTGRLPLFMLLFLFGLLLATFSSRLFCGFACPMGTVMGFETWMKSTLRWKDRPIPPWVQKGGPRIALALLLLVSIPLTLLFQFSFPLLLLLFVFAFLLTLRYSETLFHRYLCPYGFFLSFPAKRASIAMGIDAAACTNCTACGRVCPSSAISVPNKHYIHSSECLTCNRCIAACHFDAISFTKRPGSLS